MLKKAVLFRTNWFWLLLLLGAHAALLAYTAVKMAPTDLEPPLLAAGVSHWELGRYELYRVNPPLVRMIAADDWIVDAVESLAVKVLSNYELIYRNLDAVGSPGSHYNFDGLTHAVSALSRWRKIIEEGILPADNTTIFISD